MLRFIYKILHLQKLFLTLTNFQILSENYQFTEAIAIYDEALKVDSGNPNILVHKGMVILQSSGDIDTVSESVVYLLRK